VEDALSDFVQHCLKFNDAATAKRLKMRVTTNACSAARGTDA
jgi:hypothetical protein